MVADEGCSIVAIECAEGQRRGITDEDMVDDTAVLAPAIVAVLMTGDGCCVAGGNHAAVFKRTEDGIGEVTIEVTRDDDWCAGWYHRLDIVADEQHGFATCHTADMVEMGVEEIYFLTCLPVAQLYPCKRTPASAVPPWETFPGVSLSQ